jgi:hypothetical protein
MAAKKRRAKAKGATGRKGGGRKKRRGGAAAPSGAAKPKVKSKGKALGYDDEEPGDGYAECTTYHDANPYCGQKCKLKSSHSGSHKCRNSHSF